MSVLRHPRRLAVVAAGLAIVAALAAPAAAARASAGSYTPNPHQWYFDKWSIQQDVWPVTEGAGVTVAVLDSGVQASNPDLQGVVKPGGDTLSGSGNGEQDSASDGGHGTGVASLIAGQGIGSGMYGAAPVGIAPQAKILPVHVIDPSKGSAPVAEGIKYAVDHGANVINLSLGSIATSTTSCEPSEQQAVAYALAHNVIVIASSGDTNTEDGTAPEEPGTCAGVLAVGAVEPNGSLWQSSTQGSYVSVAAPGDQIYNVSSDGHQYTTAGSGTSFSAALVSGAAALIRAKYPSMPWYTVDQRLINTAVHTGAVPNNGTGYGIININKALNISQNPVPASAPNPPHTRYEAWLKSTGQSGPASGGTSTQAPKSHGGSSIVWIVVGVVVLLIVVALIIVLATRGRSRRGPRNPGGGGGYMPDGYPAPGQQYPQGQYPPQGQYQPGQYPPPGAQAYPQGPYQPGQQYPAPPGQYPPPQQ